MLPRFHLITDFPTLDNSALSRLLQVVGVDGPCPVDAVQIRAKQSNDRDVVAWTRAVVVRLRPRGVGVIVNDRLDLALAADADGVHLGRDDLAVTDARSMVSPDFVVGATCRNPQQAAQARRDGADYAGVGPVHLSTTKAGLPSPLGLEVLRATAKELPSIAIGGITVARVRDVMACGAHGVAVVAGVWASPDPPGAAEKIAELVHTR